MVPIFKDIPVARAFQLIIPLGILAVPFIETRNTWVALVGLFSIAASRTPFRMDTLKANSNIPRFKIGKNSGAKPE